jgi:hypothetical protein
MPSREMPERIWREVALAREDAFPCLRLGDFSVRRYQQRLWWVRYQPGQTDAVLAWRIPPAAAVARRSWRTDAAAGGPLRARAW